MNPYWSYLLTAVGVFGLYLAGRKDRRGWMVGIGAQVLWIAYAVSTHQWGFLVSALAYGWVYSKNAHAWKRVEAMLVERAQLDEWPPPPDVRTSVCGDCAGHIFWQECPTGGWWIHHRHPEDGHDARPGTWAPPERDEPPWRPVCRYCGADCSESRSWDGGDLYACRRCAEDRAVAHREGHTNTGCSVPGCSHPSHKEEAAADAYLAEVRAGLKGRRPPLERDDPASRSW